MERALAAAGVAGLLLAGCTSDEGPLGPVPLGSPSATPSASPSSPTTSGTGSPEPATTVSGTPSPVSPAAVAPEPTPSEAPAPQSVPPTTSIPPPMPDVKAPLPGEPAAAAAEFDQCVRDYQDLESRIVIGGAVTPVVVEGWSSDFAAASAQSVEGDYAGAAVACRSVVADMRALLG